MPRKSPRIEIDESVRRELENIASSKSEEARRVLRAKVLLGCADGVMGKVLASRFGIMPNAVIEYRASPDSAILP